MTKIDVEEVWRIREEEVYPALFGQMTRGIFPLSRDLFAHRFGVSDPDPRWLHHGVIEFEPSAGRNSWLYVTSGYSTPWNQHPDDFNVYGDSGSGVEFAFATSEQGDWAIEILQALLAFDLLHTAGHFPGTPPPKIGHVMPLRAPINGRADCALTAMLMVEAEGYPGEFTLPSGRVMVVGFTAVSTPEFGWARENGADALVRRLRSAGAHPVTNPKRPSIIEAPESGG